MFSTLEQNVIDRPATKIVTELNMATGQSLMHSFAKHACTKKKFWGGYRYRRPPHVKLWRGQSPPVPP